MKKLVKNGVIVTAADTYSGDILIEDGKIAAIGKGLDESSCEIVDANGAYIFPGGIDPHTHLDMPFGGTVTKDDFETGTIAAA
ncbi:dihydropyrimidinase, partial [Escherichia coli]|nr:dihydropyrimidinase [Escherichia coli]